MRSAPFVNTFQYKCSEHFIAKVSCCRSVGLTSKISEYTAIISEYTAVTGLKFGQDLRVGFSEIAI